MARLNLKARAVDSAKAVSIAVDHHSDDDDDDELPELCRLLRRLDHCEKNAISISVGGSKPETEVSPQRKQRPLRLAHVNSLLLLPVGRHERAINGDGGLGKDANNTRGRLGESAAVVERTKERIRKKISSRISLSDSSSPSSFPSSERTENTTDGSSDGLSDFIVDDSASELDEVEVPRIRIPNQWKRTSPWKDGKAGAGSICSIPNGSHQNLKASPKKSISGHSIDGAGRFRKEPRAGLKAYETYLPTHLPT